MDLLQLSTYTEEAQRQILWQCLGIPHREHGREAPSLPSPAVQLSASRGQEQGGCCMGWKDQEHHREKRGAHLYVGECVNAQEQLFYWNKSLGKITYSFPFDYCDLANNTNLSKLYMQSCRIQNT